MGLSRVPGRLGKVPAGRSRRRITGMSPWDCPGGEWERSFRDGPGGEWRDCPLGTVPVANGDGPFGTVPAAHGGTVPFGLSLRGGPRSRYPSYASAITFGATRFS